jgi:serine O-acetyltransferase
VNIWQLISADVKAKARLLYQSEDAKTVLKTLLTDGTFAMVVYRLMQAAQRHHLAPLAMICTKINGLIGQCIIGRGATFGPGFVLVHSQGVVINSGVVGGTDVSIGHQVTIGNEKHKCPQLGDHIKIGAGAKVLGDVRIGNHAKIGANAVVTKDVPEGATVVGIPARVVRIHGKPVSIGTGNSELPAASS